MVLVTSSSPHQPSLVLERAEGGSTVALLSFVPDFQLKEQRIEAIFLVDCSGSMAGQSMQVSTLYLHLPYINLAQLAKEALGLFLHSLPSSCYFNIVIFGNDFQTLFPTRYFLGRPLLT